jgi:hypothetical protein
LIKFEFELNNFEVHHFNLKLTYKKIGVSSNLLTIIIDTNPVSWGSRIKASSSTLSNSDYSSKPLTFSQMIEHLLVFLNAFLRIGENFVSVIANHNSGSKFLYPKEMDQNASQTSLTDFNTIKNVLLANIQSLIANGIFRIILIFFF